MVHSTELAHGVSPAFIRLAWMMSAVPQRPQNIVEPADRSEARQSLWSHPAIGVVLPVEAQMPGCRCTAEGVDDPQTAGVVGQRHGRPRYERPDVRHPQPGLLKQFLERVTSRIDVFWQVAGDAVPPSTVVMDEPTPFEQRDASTVPDHDGDDSLYRSHGSRIGQRGPRHRPVRCCPGSSERCRPPTDPPSWRTACACCPEIVARPGVRTSGTTLAIGRERNESAGPTRVTLETWRVRDVSPVAV